MGKIIGLTYDLKSENPLRPGQPRDAYAELDSEDTVNMIARALEWGGHRVKKIGNIHKLLPQIDNLGVDIVFNIAEGTAGSRNRESQVPLLLELKGIPFVGADALTLGVTLDKILAKKCFVADGIATPAFFGANSVAEIPDLKKFNFPLFVKTSTEGTSKGISQSSRVNDLASLKKQIAFINKEYQQRALVEEFISGTEFTVGVLGNDQPEALPVVQVSIDGTVELGDDFFTYDRILAPETIVYICPAKISKELTQELQALAVRAYRSVDCRDFGRVDFRVDASGRPYVLEINPLPSLAAKDVFALIPKVMGSSYEEMINRILNYGLRRYGLLEPQYEEAKI